MLRESLGTGSWDAACCIDGFMLAGGLRLSFEAVAITSSVGFGDLYDLLPLQRSPSASSDRTITVWIEVYLSIFQSN